MDSSAAPPPHVIDELPENFEESAQHVHPMGDAGQPAVFPYDFASAEEMTEFDEYAADQHSGDTRRHFAAPPTEAGTVERTGRYDKNFAAQKAAPQPQSFSSISEIQQQFPVRPAPLPEYGRPIEVLEHENIYVKVPAPPAVQHKRTQRISSEPATRGVKKRSAEPSTKGYAGVTAKRPPAKEADIKPIYTMKDNRRKRMILRAFLKTAMILALIIALCFAGYFVTPKIKEMLSSLAPEGTVSSSSVSVEYDIAKIERNSRPAHEVIFKSDKYESVYIQELKTTYLFTAGEARLLLYDDVIIGDQPQEDTVNVLLTPVFYMPSGKQETGDAIAYALDVYPTEITLLQPTEAQSTVQASLTVIKFNVPSGSTVTVDGEDVSDLADSGGNIVQNIDTSQFGDKAVTITAQALGHTAQTVVVTLTRPYMDIPIELAASVTGSSTSKTVELRGTTLPGAKISLDTTQSGEGVVETDGSFSIKATMTRIGRNDVVIRASMPGKEDTLYTLTIDYAPKLDEYSKQAWPIDEANYSELMAYHTNKIGKIFVGTGTVTAISSEDSLLYTFMVSETIVVYIKMVEGKHLELDKVYKIYCDFDSMENGKPLFIGRYYYAQ